MSTTTQPKEALERLDAEADPPPPPPSPGATLRLYWRGGVVATLFGAGFTMMSLGVLEHTAQGVREVGLARGWVWALWGFLLSALYWGLQGLLRVRRRGKPQGGAEALWWGGLVVAPLLGHIACALWLRDVGSAAVAGGALALGGLTSARHAALINHEGVWQWAGAALGACGVLVALGIALPAMPALEHPARGLWVVGWTAIALMAGAQLVLWRLIARSELPRRPRQLPALILGLLLCATLAAWHLPLVRA